MLRMHRIDAPEEAPSMPINWMPTAADYLRFLPEIILTLVGTLLMVMDAISEAARQSALRQYHDRRLSPPLPPRS